MATIVRSSPGNDLSYQLPGTPRMFHKLSTGLVLAIVVDRTTSNVYVYESANRTTWTLRNTLLSSTYTFTSQKLSSAIDASDNLHLAWINGTNVRYLKLTRVVGAAFTVGTNELVGAITNSTTVGQVDLDVNGPGTVVGVAVTSASATQAYLQTYLRNTGNTWSSPFTNAINATGTSGNVLPGMVSAAFDSTGISGSNIKLALFAAYSDGSSGTGSRKGTLRVHTINATTSAPVLDLGLDSGPLNNSNTNQFTSGNLFSVSAGVIRGLFFGGMNNNIYAMEFNVTTGYTMTTKSSTIDTGISNLGQAAVAYENGRGVFFWVNGTTIVRSKVASFENGDVVWSSHTGITFYSSPGITATGGVYSGGNRNFDVQLSSRYVADVLVSDPASDTVIHEYNTQTVPVPTVITPAHGSTVTTDTPVLSMNLTAYSGSPQSRYRGVWRIATDAALTTSLKVYRDNDFLTSGITNYTVPSSNKLVQGTWYIRGYALDEFGNESAQSANPVDDEGVSIANPSFLVAHPPSTTGHTPTADATLDYAGTGNVAFAWVFTDPSATDAQTAYQVIVERNSDGTVLHDTGKIVSANQTVSLTILAANKDEQLRWKVRVWDTSDVVSVYSPNQLFRISDKPTVVITAPADGGTANNPAPTVTWTFTASGGRVQSNYRVVFYTGGGVPIFESPTVPGAGLSYTPPNPILEVSQSYLVKVEVTDNRGLGNIDTNAFTTVWTPPATVAETVSISSFDTSGYVSITWTNAGKDATWDSYRVYRRVVGTTAWTLLHETKVVAASYEYRDYTAKSGVSYEYVVVQNAERFGSYVEGSYGSPSTANPVSESYWIIDVEDANFNVRLPSVTADDYTEEYEEEFHQLIGRGRKKDSGTRLGYAGSLTAQLYDISGGLTARQQKAQLELLRGSTDEVYLRNPFGDIWLVALSNISVSRISGVGNREFCTVTIPYSEVA